MKDLILTSADGTISHVFRTDMLANDSTNFNITAIDPPTDPANTRAVDNISLFGHTFRNIPHSLNFIKTFCTTNNLKLTIQDGNGNNPATLVAWGAPVGTQYPIVSANGGTKTILVATDVHASFLTGNHLVIYNADYSIFGSFTENGNSTYSAPNTSIVVNETLATIGTSSGKFIINNH